MAELKNKIIKTELVKWSGLTWLQPKELKDTDQATIDKLKNSLLKNGFASPFNVWKSGKITYILDGHHREKAIKELESENNKIPSMLPANFLKCKDKREAKKMVLVFNSHYATINQGSLFDFVSDLDLEGIQAEIEINDIDFEQFENIETVNSEDDEWVGMPDFEEKEDDFKVIIHFDKEKTRETYINRNKIKIRKKEKQAWITSYPFKGRDDLVSVRYE